MHIAQKYAEKRPLISFEIFPPKKQSGLDTIGDTIRMLSVEEPDFISVTCGAGGSGSIGLTGDIASLIKREGKSEPLAHLTCVSAGRTAIHDTLSALRAGGVDNVLALRGDPTVGADSGQASGDYRHASDLIADIHAFGGFCIGSAAYPEGHVDCEDIYQDLYHLKHKQDSGVDFFISQLFFDNDYFYRFFDRARSAGISIPVSAGVMPILGRSQVERMIFMCGASLPSPIIRMLHKYEHNPADLRKAGIERAVRQMEDLIHHEVDGVHIYTMNHADIAQTAMKRLRP